MRAAKRVSGNEKSAKPFVQPEWSALLVDAVAKPGVISTAYARFWNYSTGNQLLAMWQCAIRRIEPGPIHTFLGWKELDRFVKKGEKAITLCMPVTVKRKPGKLAFDPALVRIGDGAERQLTGPGGIVPDPNAQTSITLFAYKPHWFLLSQTEGAEYVPTELPEWSEARVFVTLAIDRVPFHHPDGNCQGFARARSVAVSPIAVMPHKTLFHELAHVVLGHTGEDPGLLDDHDHTPRSLREVEAECVALICCESLTLGGAEFSRGYIQHWLHGQSVPERSAQKIFKAADQILRAGRMNASPSPDPT